MEDKQIVPVIITGRSSEILVRRCRELGIVELYQGIEDKTAKLLSICKKFQVEASNVAYIGDDLNDLECMKICGYSAAPADAAKEVLASVDYICKHRGGEGAVREFIEQL